MPKGIYKRSRRTKILISMAKKGHPVSEKAKQKISEAKKGKETWNKGIKHSEETKQKIRNSMKGNIPWNKGVKWSEENKRRISIGMKGHIPWNKGLKGYSNAGGYEKGHKHSEEVRKKMSISHKGVKLPERTGKNHHAWKEESEIAYSSMHDWVRNRKGKASKQKCFFCGKSAMDWANADHQYKRNLDDYIPLCRACHIKYDKLNFK